MFTGETPHGTRGEPGNTGLTAGDVRAALGTTTLGVLTLLERGDLRIDEDSVAEYIARRLPDPYALAAIDARAPRA